MAIPMAAALEGRVNATKRVVVSTSKVNATNTANGITTFWLRGGTPATPVQQAQVKITTSLGEAEGVLLTWTMLSN